MNKTEINQALTGQTVSVTLNLFQGLFPSELTNTVTNSLTGQINIDRSQSTRQTGSHNSQARWFALSTKFGMTQSVCNNRKAAFTLAEGGQSPHVKADNDRRVAFTLAEVLITLGIIGVVAALTIPMFMENVNDRIKAKRIENIKQKLSKVTDKMASLDKLQGYNSTYDFVIEMKNHMAIAKVCKDHVENCWPTSEVNIRKHASGDKSNTYQISKITSPDELRLRTEFINWAEPVGIITADGTSMIISYNKDCPITSDTGIVFDQASSTSNSLSCIAGIFDWNGKAKPNFIGDDIQSLGVATIAGSCTAEVKMNDGTYICTAGTAHIPTPLTSAHCSQYSQEGKFGIPNPMDCRFGTNYWLGAVAECGGRENMFTMEELKQIADYIHAENLISKREEKMLSLGLPIPRSGYYTPVWSSDIPDGAAFNAKVLKFELYGTTPTTWTGYHDNAGILNLCKGD